MTADQRPDERVEAIDQVFIEDVMAENTELRARAARAERVVDIANNLVMALSDQPATPARIEGEAEGWLDELILALMYCESAADATPPDPPKAIIRPDDAGQPDDFVIEDVTRFRLERMAAGSWWLACYRGDERLSLFLNSKKHIECVIAEDWLGCVDDREGGDDA